MENFALKILKETSSNGWVYIATQNFCPLVAGKDSFALPVDWPNGHISYRCASGRPPGRPGLDTESSSSLSVNQFGRPGPFPESRALWTVDRIG